MAKRIASVCALLVLLAVSTATAQVKSRIDLNGRTVFYNIPTKQSFLESAALYYSRKADDYVNTIHAICSRHGVDAELVKAVIQVESAYNPFAVSPKGASGLMQLMPATAARYGVKKIFDPEQNIEGGVKYLKDLLQLFNSDLSLVVAAYNAGEGIVQRLGNIPDYRETQNYVRKVLALYHGEASYTPIVSPQKPRVVSYYKYQDAKGITHYTMAPATGAQATKITFYY